MRELLPDKNKLLGLSRRWAAVIVLSVVCAQVATALTESDLRIAGAEFTLVTIPPGSFLMGSESGDGDEQPVHKVTIDYSFDIGKTEVTVGQFKAFVQATGYKTDAEKHGGALHCPCPELLGFARDFYWKKPPFTQTEKHPVICVSFNDATEFCRWLTEETGQHFRLPFEAEWEYACKAGTTGDFAGDIKQMAWFHKPADAGTAPVASKKPNPWGLYDMHGNVWEWSQDFYNLNYRSAPTDGGPNLISLLHPAVRRRVLRGGAWCKPTTSCTSSFRLPAHPAFRETGTGFRIVRSTAPPPKTESPPLTQSKTSENRSESSRLPARIVLTVGNTDFRFNRIEPGSFIMGSEHVPVDEYGWSYELPSHKVTINYGYYMATTEVTLEQFDLFVEDSGYVTDAEKYGFVFTCLPEGTAWHYEILADWRFPGYVQTDTEPVTHITWYDAMAFCQWLSEKTGRIIRLPSEAEWEYPCRAGTAGDYPGELHELGWYLWNSTFRTSPVAQKKPNRWGLYDMHGNVWEWVLDLWHPDSNTVPTNGSARFESALLDPAGITRGGSFANPPWLCRSYSRMRTTIGPRAHYNNGFRILREIDAADFKSFLP